MLPVLTIITIWLTLGGAITFYVVLANSNSDPEAVAEVTQDTGKKSAVRNALEILQMFALWPLTLFLVVKAHKNGLTPLEQIVQDKKPRKKVVETVSKVKSGFTLPKMPPIDKDKVIEITKTSDFYCRDLGFDWKVTKRNRTDILVRFSLYAVSKDPKKEWLFPSITHFLQENDGMIDIYRGLPDGPEFKWKSASSFNEAVDICNNDHAWIKACAPKVLQKIPNSLLLRLMREL